MQNIFQPLFLCLHPAGIQSFLLSGPPGTGKTLLARATGSSLRRPLISVRCSTLASKWRGDAERLARAVFEVARANAPCVVFLDEVDAIMGGDRAAGKVHEATRRCE